MSPGGEPALVADRQERDRELEVARICRPPVGRVPIQRNRRDPALVDREGLTDRPADLEHRARSEPEPEPQVAERGPVAGQPRQGEPNAELVSNPDPDEQVARPYVADRLDHGAARKLCGDTTRRAARRQGDEEDEKKDEDEKDE